MVFLPLDKGGRAETQKHPGELPDLEMHILHLHADDIFYAGWGVG